MANVDEDWARALREWGAVEEDVAKQAPLMAPDEDVSDGGELDLAFAGRYSLLNTDQGVRAYMQVVNDLVFVLATQDGSNLNLEGWEILQAGDGTDEVLVSAALQSLGREPVDAVLTEVARNLADFDWRTAGDIRQGPKMPPELRDRKLAYRGSGGYSVLRRHVLVHLIDHGEDSVSGIAREAAGRLGYLLDESDDGQ